MIHRILTCVVACLLVAVAHAQQNIKLKKKDRRRDIEMTTTQGTIVLRLSDSTPLHRDNFLRLVKTRFYDSVLFHRVIENFMIQGGDPNSKTVVADQPIGSGGPGYKVPAEFRTSLFHKKGVLAAARNDNPEKESSGSQFYIVQGKKFTDAGLDSVEINRLGGRKLPPAHREVYKTLGGVPHLDQNYTVYGEVVRGLDVVDTIAKQPTSSEPPNRPQVDIRIIRARLIKRR
ncbi:MAG: peptidylprolyl isomerase [Chitinophagaceae bacterium]